MRELGGSQAFRPKQSQMVRCKQSPFLLEEDIHLERESEKKVSSLDYNSFYRRGSWC